MVYRLALAAGGAALLAAGAASASTIVEFDLQGNSSTNYYWLSPSHSATEDGVTALFSAGAFTSVTTSGNSITSAAFASDPRIGLYSGGAGVTNSPTDDSHTVDGGGYKDFIEIRFDDAVMLTEISFGYYDTNDHFRWMYDSNGDGEIGVGDFISDAFSVSANNPFSGFGGVSSTLFAVGAFDDYEICYKDGKQGRKKKSPTAYRVQDRQFVEAEGRHDRSARGTERRAASGCGLAAGCGSCRAGGASVGAR